MSTPSPLPPRPHPMHVVGAVVLAALGLYVLFWAVDGTGLETRRATATVLEKQHRLPGKTYTSRIIAGRVYTMPSDTPEMFVLGLDLEGQPTEHAVTRAAFDAVAEGDKIPVSYRRRRLTGALEVVEAGRTPG